MLSRTAAALLATLTASFATLAAPPRFAIVDLSIGQTAAAVEPLIRKIGPAVREGRVMYRAEEGFPSTLATLHGTVGRRGGFGYTSIDFDETVQVSFGRSTGRAFLVMRRIGTAHAPALVRELEAGLLERYGPPTFRAPGQMQWTYRADGSPATHADMCSRQEIVGQGVTQIGNPPSERCGVTFSVLYSATARDPDRVYTAAYGLFDHQEMIRDQREDDARRKALDDARHAATVKALEGVRPRQ